MREGASVLRGGAFYGQGEHLCRGRPALGLPIAADDVDGDQGQRRGCGGRRSPSGRPTFERGRSAVNSMSLFSKLGRPPAARRSCGLNLGDQNSNLRPATRTILVRMFLSFCNEGKPHGSLQGGSRNLQVESLAKLREDEESTDLNVSLRVARANGVGDFSRLMLEIARARFECARVLSH